MDTTQILQQQPTIEFQTKIDYSVNELEEKGQSVSEDFEYSSDNKTEWLSKEQLLSMI